ncbi:hypothetical protein [Hydrogenophaga palleronii]|uniref:hypothetical protein n=1 Tax=Hydrogenophaga palleronii TaxID=65655 RepID=UPI000824228C|nr:hypothetical protein [Hydrogenophaga palleronii]
MTDEAALLHSLRGRVANIIRRAPEAQDASRWHPLHLAGRDLRLALPITFTPYASARPCSARCAFCSENLRPTRTLTPAALLRPEPDYFAGLARALRALRGVPLSWSLSGLENSDDSAWLLQLLSVLQAAEQNGIPVQERVLYSNGSGFALVPGPVLLDALQRFGLSWVELSRHHHQGAANQAIMRFRPGQPITRQPCFEQVVQQLAARLPLRLVCLLQQGGIASPDGVADYLAWAAHCGAGTVIFREFSRLDRDYRDNGTARYLASARVPMAPLLRACLDDPRLGPRWQLCSLTEGYYFQNLRVRTPEGLEVVFEWSDYGAMHERHASGEVYKLVYFANGQLCAGWDPGHDVLLDTRIPEGAPHG